MNCKVHKWRAAPGLAFTVGEQNTVKTTQTTQTAKLNMRVPAGTTKKTQPMYVIGTLIKTSRALIAETIERTSWWEHQVGNQTYLQSEMPDAPAAKYR